MSRKPSRSLIFPKSFKHIRIGDRCTLVLDVNTKSVPLGTEVKGEVIFVGSLPASDYFIVQAPSLAHPNYLIFYTIFPKADSRYTWKFKIRYTELDFKMRERARLERDGKFQLNLLQA